MQNVTDVDDPLLERAARDGEDWRELADREIALFRRDMEALRVLPPTHYVGAVEALPVIERLGKLLADHGAVYEVDGDMYFARSADPAFGAVSGLDAATMIALFAERGGDPGRPGKKDPLDPLVWLAARPGEPAWPSSFGNGRPGWHVECAAIATEYLGVTFDVQAGGSDLVFPHHEMSASHARVALGALASPGDPVFARHYVHAGMVRLDGEKMSKSRGNLVFVSEAAGPGRRPDGDQARGPRAPLPRGLGLDRSRSRGRAGAARPVARGPRAGPGPGGRGGRGRGWPGRGGRGRGWPGGGRARPGRG